MPKILTVEEIKDMRTRSKPWDREDFYNLMATVEHLLHNLPMEFQEAMHFLEERKLTVVFSTYNNIPVVRVADDRGNSVIRFSFIDAISSFKKDFPHA